MSNAVSKEGALQSLKLYRLQRCFNLSDEVLDVAIAALEEIQQYRAIGTVSEFRELKEKATGKHRCHNCGELLKGDYIFCPTCRRKIDWSEGKE